MTITTSHTVEGHTIGAYLGIVSAAMIFVMPGGNKMVMKGYQNGVNGVLALLENEAVEKGADAIIAVQINQQGTNICAYGTAVKFLE